jgi:hypothetical protein
MRSALLATAALVAASSAVAQQKQQVAHRVPAENSKYTQQLTINVGDIPNHVARVFEIHYTFTNNAPVINGLKVVESWDRGFGDRIEGSGPLTLYTEFVMDNGDKFFTRIVGIVQNTAGKLTSTNVGNILGGTGKLTGIQGNIRSGGSFNYNTGVSEPQVEIEYWIAK